MKTPFREEWVFRERRKWKESSVKFVYNVRSFQIVPGGRVRPECWEELATKEPRAELFFWDTQCSWRGPSNQKPPGMDLGGVQGPLHSKILTTLTCHCSKSLRNPHLEIGFGSKIVPQTAN